MTLDDLDLSKIAYLEQKLADVKSPHLFAKVKDEVKREIMALPFAEQMAERAYIIEREAIKRTVAMERQRTRLALNIPARLGDETVYVYHLRPEEFELHDVDADAPDVRATLYKDFDAEDPMAQIVLTPKQRRSIVGHRAGSEQNVDGITVFGDWRDGFVRVEVATDQVRLDGVRRPAYPVNIFIGHDHNIVRGPCESY